MAGLAGTVAQGMAFGTGSAIAHRAVGAVANSFGGSNEGDAEPVQQQQQYYDDQAQQQPHPCFNDERSFLQCLQTNNNDIASCQFYFDRLNECKIQTQEYGAKSAY